MFSNGCKKSPKKHGKTMIVPKIYHGALLPILVLILSESAPTNGVINPSANYPQSIASPAYSAERLTMNFK